MDYIIEIQYTKDRDNILKREPEIAHHNWSLMIDSLMGMYGKIDQQKTIETLEQDGLVHIKLENNKLFIGVDKILIDSIKNRLFMYHPWKSLFYGLCCTHVPKVPSKQVLSLKSDTIRDQTIELLEKVGVLAKVKDIVS